MAVLAVALVVGPHQGVNLFFVIKEAAKPNPPCRPLQQPRSFDASGAGTGRAKAGLFFECNLTRSLCCDMQRESKGGRISEHGRHVTKNEENSGVRVAQRV